MTTEATAASAATDPQLLLSSFHLFGAVLNRLFMDMQGQEFCAPFAGPAGGPGMKDDVYIEKLMIAQPAVSDHEWFIGLGRYRGNLGKFLGDIIVVLELPYPARSSLRKLQVSREIQATLEKTLDRHTALLSTIHGQLLWRGFGASDFLHKMEDVFAENRLRFDYFAVKEKVAFAPPEFIGWNDSSAEFTVWRWRPAVVPFLVAGIHRAMM